MSVGDKVDAYYDRGKQLIGTGLTVIGFDREYVVLRGDGYTNLKKYPRNVVRVDSDLELDKGL